MHKQRIYIDTSVIGGCFDSMFAEWSNKLFDEFIAGEKIAVISPTTTDEINNAPSNVQDKLNQIPAEFIEILIYNNEINDLANEYIQNNAVPYKSFDDATHIAYATYYKTDYLVSWNFKHIVNVNRIKKYNSINLVQGYSIIDIRTPREVLNDENE
jgi:predicted nucleic acid-binding protein